MSKSVSEFEDLFISNYNTMCNIARNIIKDSDGAQDIVQEVFIKLWDKKTALLEISNVKGYLFRATTNASINYLSQNKKIISLETSGVTLSINPDETITTKELEAKIQYALDRLPPKCKAIFILSRFEGMKYAEIAEHLDISEKTVKNQMLIALNKMREDLRPYLTKEFLALALSTGISFLVQFLSLYLIVTFVTCLF
ncbi:MAG: RNA polymerase sigma-70 factor [Bacteroidota bacterium]|nr:RNA polymerase sigma-70 factor [Bacteroidota bacterium]